MELDIPSLDFGFGSFRFAYAQGSVRGISGPKPGAIPSLVLGRNAPLTVADILNTQ